MRFHNDTRSAWNEDQGSTLNFQNRAKASGSFGAGPWGVSAEVENTMGYEQCAARSTRAAQASERHRLRTQGGLLTTSLTHEREMVARRESVGRGCAPWLSRTPLQAAPRFP